MNLGVRADAHRTARSGMRDGYCPGGLNAARQQS